MTNDTGSSVPVMRDDNEVKKDKVSSSSSLCLKLHYKKQIIHFWNNLFRFIQTNKEDQNVTRKEKNDSVI
jgi:hypothetical protein